MLMHYTVQAGWVAGIALSTAFILTFWSSLTFQRLAAALYSVGTLVGIGVETYAWVVFLWMNFHLTDAPSVHYGPFIAALVLPTGKFLYGLFAVALLWPGISQEKALRLGKILHLIILPLLVSAMFALALLQPRDYDFSDVRWLIYGPLWFRIRESYATFSVSRNLEPAN